MPLVTFLVDLSIAMLNFDYTFFPAPFQSLLTLPAAFVRFLIGSHLNERQRDDRGSD